MSIHADTGPGLACSRAARAGLYSESDIRRAAGPNKRRRGIPLLFRRGQHGGAKQDRPSVKILRRI